MSDELKQDVTVANTAAGLARHAGKVAGTVAGTVAGNVAVGMDAGLKRGRSYAQDAKLNMAVRKGSYGKTREALRQGADPNIAVSVTGPSKARNGKSALAYALNSGYYDVAHALLDAGADPNRMMNGNQSTVSLIEYIATRGRLNPKEEEQILRVAQKMMDKGADVTFYHAHKATHPTFLHRIAKHAMRPEVAKMAALNGAPVTAQDGQGRIPESCIDRDMPKPFRKQAEAVYWVLRQHREAPCPDLGSGDVSREDLMLQQENGFCALDHWQTWDQYEQVQQQLQAKGERLSASDLLQPYGTSDAKDAPTRLQVLLETSPAMTRRLFDTALWEGETLETATAFYKQLPKEVQENAPYYALRAKLGKDESLSNLRGR